METLRAEILESQKARSDLLKWKLVVVAALGAAGMGFTGGNSSYAHVVLCFIPFACVYVDLLCRHLNLQITVIGQFLKSEKPADTGDQYVHLYEKFSGKFTDAFFLEAWALHWSTITLSVLIIPIGIALQYPDDDAAMTAMLNGLFGFCGIAGVLLSLWGKKRYESKREHIIKCTGKNLDEVKRPEQSCVV